MEVRGICFDFGGTLDAPGIHWLERFAELYRAAGCDYSWATIRDAFDFATQSAYRDMAVADLELQPLIEFHVDRQLERLKLDDEQVRLRVITDFVNQARASLAASRQVLKRLRQRYTLGVISNFYGNVDRLLDEAGLSPMLSSIIDSNCVGVSKPDPAIFQMAVEQMGCAAHEVLYVGDSFDKDVRGARGAGLKTAWFTGERDLSCPDPSLVDLVLRRLDDLGRP